MRFIQGAALLASSLLAATVDAAPSQTFTWNNAKIGGGGGFVPGIVFNPTEKGLAYARTDIGGAYRLNADDSWTPLTDWANATNWNNWGIDALATDPVDTNRLYLAVGMYTISWDPNNGQILRSNDKGNTWARTTLPFKVGGNMPGRGMGERLVVDPNKNNILYFGARSGNGLWKSTDYGVTWAKVTTFTWPGTYVQNSTSEYTSDKVGIAWVTFDTTSGPKGAATPRIFVGVADVGQSVFKSEDGGATWAWVAGEPQNKHLPHKGVLSPSDKLLYVTYSDGAGPYDGTKGTVHKYDITSGVWTDISPTPLADGFYGYGGFALDLQKPGTIMVAALNQWWPEGMIWRSTNSGATWSPIWEWNGYPGRFLYYGYDISQAPWLHDTSSTDEFINNVGWMMEALAIDPFDSDHWLYGTGATIYGGHDLTKWDTAHNVTIKSLANGIEETAILGLISPPGGPPLLSAVGDIGGFYHSNLDEAPVQSFHSPTYGTTNDIDYAGNSPANIVRTGWVDDFPRVALSSNFGSSWSPHYGAAVSVEPGKIAISANAAAVVLISGNSGPLVSINQATFSAIPTLPSGSAIASDKRNNTVFYGGSAGKFYLSTNSGSSFVQTATLGTATFVNAIKVNPTLAGDVWASTDAGLFHSTNYGSTFTQIGSGVTEGWSFALGAGSTATAYPVIYGSFTIDGVSATYKSEDKGLNWAMISDLAHGFGSPSANVIGADITKYGRVFVGTNGRGIFYGAPSGPAPTGTVTGPGATSTSKPVSSTIKTTLTTSTRVSSSFTSSASSSTVKPSSSSSTKAPTSTSKTTSATSTTSSAGSGPTAGPFGQCGGTSWTGPTACPAGWKCTYSNPWYSQCLQ